MTIIFDAKSSASIDYAGSISYSHTVGSGSNRILVVGIFVPHSGDKVTSVTYGGIALTRVMATTPGVGISAVTYIYQLINPSTGTGDVVIALGSADLSANSFSASFFGVDQTVPISASNGLAAAYAESPKSLTISTPSGGVAIDMIGSPVTKVYTQGSGQTLVYSLANPGNTSFSGMSYKTDATAMDWTWTGGTTQSAVSQSIVALAPAVGGNAAPTFPGPNIGTQSGTVGVALTSNNIASKFSDTDALTFSAIGSWPAGVTVSSVGVISGTPTTAGTYASLKVRATDTAFQTIDSDTFTFTIAAAAAGTITLPACRQWETGNLRTSESGVVVIVNNPTTGALVVNKTGLTTHATTGECVVTDPAIVTGTNYRVTQILPDGSEGTWRYTAT